MNIRGFLMNRIPTDLTKQNTVPVFDSNGVPLIPTRPSRARLLMKQGRARKIWQKDAFCIRMLDISTASAQKIGDYQ